MNRAVALRCALFLASVGNGFSPPAAAGPPPPSEVGQWSAPMSWPVVAIHAHLLPDGKVMFWDRHDAADDGDPRLFDPTTNLVTSAPMPEDDHDLFCSGHVLLGDGRLFVAGGHIEDRVGQAHASLFDPATGIWTPLPPMNAGRWYPTATLLANGEVIVASGNIDVETGVNTIPQVWSPKTNTWRTLTGAALELPLYPFLFLTSNGRVFTAGPQPNTGYFDPEGLGSFTLVATSNHGFRRYGSAVLYDHDRILITGGTIDPPTASAEVINLRDPVPSWRMVAPMAFARRQLNLTLLPDGTALATGGTSAPGFNNPEGAVREAEVFDPKTETWRTLAAATEARLYHSVALLLPDARVLVAGGGHPNGGGDDPDHFSAEIFSPPYLFQGPRPTLSSVPVAVRYGETFFAATPDGAAIDAVTWLRLSSVTHAFDQNQRINRLTFAPAPGGLHITAPSDPRLSPPGDHMLFLLDGGVPSEAKTVRIVPPLFADGFEGGTTAVWTLTVP